MGWRWEGGLDIFLIKKRMTLVKKKKHEFAITDLKDGTYVYLWLIHADVWQKPTQYCKVIILQLKINFKKLLHRGNHHPLVCTPHI